MEKQNKQRNCFQGILYSLILSFGCLFFGVFCVYATKTAWIRFNALWICLAITLTVVLMFGVSMYALFYKKETVYKVTTTLLIGAFFCLVLLYLLLKMNFFGLVKDKEALADYLQKYGTWMPVVYVVLQFLQVVILPIPSVLSTAVGVALFGANKAILYSVLGIVLGSFTAFWIGRKLGNRAVEWLIGKESLIKWQKKLKGKDNFVLTVMFLLPMFPDDVLCFVAGLSSMSLRYFSIMIILSRLFAVVSTCYSIRLIPFNTWWGVCIWGVLLTVIILAFFFSYKYMDVIQQKISNRKKRNTKR